MNSLVKLGVAFVIGSALYVTLFSFFIHKPMTVRVTIDYIHAKRIYLERIQDKRKILILAGSNGRFSHSCKTVEKVIEVPCANLSIAAGFDLFYQWSQYKEFVRAGDLLYMPLEYRRNEQISEWTIGDEGKLIARYDHSFLRELSAKKAISALFSFDVRFFISALGEMLLNASGKKTRFGTFTLTEQGDESGHDLSQSAPYRSFIRDLPVPVLDPDGANERVWGDLLKILFWATEHGVIVVGGLPTTFDGVEIPDKFLAAYRQMFIERGHRFLLLDNKSLYPRDQFYDTAYHLRQEAQIQHSVQVARGLQQLLSAK